LYIRRDWGGKYEIETIGGIEKQRLYLDGSPYTAYIMLEKTGTADLQTYYLHRDYLGSITQISNNNGNLVAEYNYDAWGRLRNPSNWQVYSQSTQPTMLYGGRGYTGHEQLNQFGLINMNARLYDPLLGRFLAPDPFVGSGLTNDFNRYIYGRNNPMMYTDPDGKFAWLAFLAGTLIVEGISYLAGVRDTGYKDWTPHINTVIGGGYSGYNGYYGGISFDGGNHFSNLGWKDGLTAGTSHDGVTQMSSVIQSFNPMQKVVQREQEMRQEDADRMGGYGTGGYVISLVNLTGAYLGGGTFDTGTVIDKSGDARMYITIGATFGFGASAGMGGAKTNKDFKTDQFGGDGSNINFTLPALPFMK